MDIPLEALQLITETAPPGSNRNHSLTWSPENGFMLNVWASNGMWRFNFEYGEELDDITAQIEDVTGIILPSEKDMKKKGSLGVTPLLDGIKKTAIQNGLLSAVAKGMKNSKLLNRFAQKGSSMYGTFSPHSYSLGPMSNTKKKLWDMATKVEKYRPRYTGMI